MGLEVRKFGVISIPLIMDSGAPGCLYLGSKPLEILREMNLLQEVVIATGGPAGHPYVAKNAVISHGEWKIDPVFISPVPHPHESQDAGTIGNICCNILGAQGLWHLPNLLRMREELNDS